MKEVWKDIPGHEGVYQASCLGQIRSLDRVRRYNTYGSGQQKGIILKTFQARGYVRVSLSTSGKGKKHFVHRLVFQAFFPEISIDQINHVNGVKNDNRVVNLESVSSSENVRHAYNSGLTQIRKGEGHHLSLLNDSIILEIFKLRKEGKTQQAIADKFGILREHVRMVLLRKCWKHVPVDESLLYSPDPRNTKKRPLSPELIIKIINQCECGLTNSEISQMLSIPRQTVNNIRNRYTRA